jgi:hypothetical protein
MITVVAIAEAKPVDVDAVIAVLVAMLLSLVPGVSWRSPA